jgi:hypothetical protein
VSHTSAKRKHTNTITVQTTFSGMSTGIYFCDFY